MSAPAGRQPAGLLVRLPRRRTVPLTEAQAECLQSVEDILRSENTLLERFKDELLKKDELEYDEIEAVFAEYGKQRPIPAPTTPS